MRKQIVDNLNEAEMGRFPRKRLDEFVNKDNEEFATEDALNLLSKLLELNPVSHWLHRSKDSPPSRPSTTPSSVIDHQTKINHYEHK